MDELTAVSFSFDHSRPIDRGLDDSPAETAPSAISSGMREPSTNSFFGAWPWIAQLGTNKMSVQLARLIVSPVRWAPQRMNEVLHHGLTGVASHREREARHSH
jgi:hypothetical protein